MEIDDNFYLNLAINEAWKHQGLTYPNPAVGCTVVDKNGTLLSVEAHKKANHAHAELEAVKSALKKLNPNFTFPNNPKELHGFIIKNHQNLLKNAHIFVTLEPCAHEGKTPSCAKLLKALHVKRVVIGTKDTNKKASGGIGILQSANISVKLGVLEKESKELLEPFNTWQKESFKFFKLALSLNGVYDGGIITCKASRHHAHKLRDRCDLLAIGGNTVRVDRPKLDARLCGGDAPDVMIYSKKSSFDKTIPLFSIPNRSVHVKRDFDILNAYKFIMFEGGQGFLEATRKKVDWFLIFHSPNFKKGKTIKLNKKLKMLWQGEKGEDRYGWYKKET